MGYANANPSYGGAKISNAGFRGQCVSPEFIVETVTGSDSMRNQQLAVLILVWAMSIILLGATRSTYLVEKTMEIFNFEFPSKETYVLTVGIVDWVRWLYFGALAFLTFHLFQRQHRWQ